jgi:Holliday junction resolvase RusA-like endonuclease
MNILESPVTFYAIGIPKGQPRPKAFSRGNHAGVYDPGTANEWKASVAEGFKTHHGMSYNQPLAVEIWLSMPRPKAHFGSKGLKPNAPDWHTQKPDLDNAAKAILDAMTDFQFWKDDSVVCNLTISKSWTDGTPGATIRISNL